MRILIACEFSGIVRDAFSRRGHYAVSCDLLPSEKPGEHVQGDVREILDMGWDLVIAHPPCTDLAVSGAVWFERKRADGSQQRSIDFFMEFTKLSCKFAIENPIGIMSRLYRKPDQIVQPWMFGHPEQKATCLWLNGLPKLAMTNNVKEQMALLPDSQRQRIHYLSPGPNRWKERSRTFSGIAEAIASQWG